MCAEKPQAVYDCARTRVSECEREREKCAFLSATSTARLWSDMETLVLRCQHTCMVVLARWWLCLSREQRDEFTSSSDSCSNETSSDDPNAVCRERTGGAMEGKRSGDEKGTEQTGALEIRGKEKKYKEERKKEVEEEWREKEHGEVITWREQQGGMGFISNSSKVVK